MTLGRIGRRNVKIRVRPDLKGLIGVTGKVPLSMNNRLLMTSVLLCSFGIGETRVFCQLPVHVVLPRQARNLERLAASELADQYQRIFDVRVTVSTAIPKDATHVVLIGDPHNNAAIKDILGSQWPSVSDQGIVLKGIRSHGRHCVIVGGGSPVATLWAAYELGHRHGIRYLLRYDIDPPQKPYRDDLFDVVMEPQFRTRTWRTIDDFAIGPESWGLADHEKTLRQLAKMKFNRVMLSVHPWQPFVDYEIDGVRKQTALLWYGDRLRIDGDTPGKKSFNGRRFFENPDFAGKSTYKEMTAAGIKLVRGISRSAHRLGMTVGLSISPLEFPREFAKVLPGAREQTGLNNLTIGPGPSHTPDDPLFQRMVATKIRAYIKTYPSIDALYLGMPEFPDWTEHAQIAWKQLNAQGDLKETNLNRLIQKASRRSLTASGERGMRSIKSNLVSLAFFRLLFEKHSLLKRGDGEQVALVIRQVDPALFPVLDRVIPPGASVLNFIDYTARRLTNHMEMLSLAPADKVKCRLILTLADDNVGPVAQSATASLGKLVTQMQKLGWDGFSTRYWIPGELDSSVHFLSRVAFDSSVTPRSAHDDLWITITDNPSAVERLWKGFEHLEAATDLIDRHDLGFAFPFKGMMMKHYRAEPVPEWWKEASEHYSQWMIELYRANGAVAPRARKTLFYYAKRGEFNLFYLGAVEALRNAAIAKSNGETEKTIEELEKSVESLYNALTTIADVAQGPSDRGLIAVLAEYAYRPLLSEYERMLDVADSQ